MVRRCDALLLVPNYLLNSRRSWCIR